MFLRWGLDTSGKSVIRVFRQETESRQTVGAISTVVRIRSIGNPASGNHYTALPIARESTYTIWSKILRCNPIWTLFISLNKGTVSRPLGREQMNS